MDGTIKQPFPEGDFISEFGTEWKCLVQYHTWHLNVSDLVEVKIYRYYNTRTPFKYQYRFGTCCYSHETALPIDTDDPILAANLAEQEVKKKLGQMWILFNRVES